MTKRAELKSLYSPQLQDIEVSQPPDPADFEILVQAMIGLEGEEGADTFDFVVCTPNRLIRRVAAEGPLSGHSYLFVEKYDYDVIRREIARYCATAMGPSWPQVAAVLSRYGQWEYENAADE
jgi:Immunity protein 8